MLCYKLVLYWTYSRCRVWWRFQIRQIATVSESQSTSYSHGFEEILNLTFSWTVSLRGAPQTSAAQAVLSLACPVYQCPLCTWWASGTPLPLTICPNKLKRDAVGSSIVESKCFLHICRCSMNRPADGVVVSFETEGESACLSSKRLNSKTCDCTG